MKENIAPHPTQLLQKAIHTLEKFAQENESTPIPHMHHFDVIDGQLITE